MSLNVHYWILSRFIWREKFGEFCLLVFAGMDVCGDRRLLKLFYRWDRGLQRQSFVEMFVEMGAGRFEDVDVRQIVMFTRRLHAGDRRTM
ncbi:uncharacterized protein BDV14DRAFT_176502 [Aspergillus stella-maris]|uniref:uncharacterized protein n=1 Tax=Aspergillus stella-maris TaxID=1810926 RepID=UPI003CCD6BA0